MTYILKPQLHHPALAKNSKSDQVVWMQTCAAVGTYDGDASNAHLVSVELTTEKQSGRTRVAR